MERCRSQAGRFQPSERCDMVWSWSEPPIEKTGTSVLQPWIVLAVCMTSEEALSPGSPEGEAAQQCLDVSLHSAEQRISHAPLDLDSQRYGLVPGWCFKLLNLW